MKNLLPKDGDAVYFGKVFSSEECVFWMDYLLMEIPWKHDEVLMFGKTVFTKRKVAWFADWEMEYRYSGKTRRAEIFPEKLRELKTAAEEISDAKFNSCLLNLYQDGSQGMSWHSDDEKEMLHSAGIAALSFGAERKFVFRHKITKEKAEQVLENGSLLLMKGDTQKFWQHSVPISKKNSAPRISLTFRTVAKI